MLYQAYKKKLAKYFDVFKEVWRFRIIIIIGIAALIALITTLLCITGNIYGDICSDTAVYGSRLQIETKSIFRRTSFEYRKAGTQDWFEDEPYLVGSYEVRAVSKDAGGKIKYGKIHSYDIIPLKTYITPNDTIIFYGQEPSFDVALAYKDEIQFDLEYNWQTNGLCNVFLLPEKFSVINEEGVEVTECYDLQVNWIGAMTVMPRPITLTTFSSKKVYDGKPLKDEVYEISSGEIVEGERLEVVFPYSITNVGSIINSPNYSVYNSDGEDVTRFYKFILDLGTLVVTPRYITLEVNGATKVYDGKPLKVETYQIVDGEMAEGDKLELKFEKSITDVGEVINKPDCYVYNAEGKSVTNNYQIIINSIGTLKVTPRLITLAAHGGEKMYDGKPLKVETYDISVGEIADGDRLDITFPYSITDVGEIFNIPYYLLYNAQNRDVTENYIVYLSVGVLKVAPRPITIQTGSETWIYDGKWHGCDKVEVNSEIGLVDGHNIKVLTVTTVMAITDSDTEVGYEENALTFIIEDSKKEDVTSNYEISIELGKLRIKTQIFVEIFSLKKFYDGKPLAFMEDDYSIIKIPPDIKEVIMSGLSTIGGLTEVNEKISLDELRQHCTFVVFDMDDSDVTSEFLSANGIIIQNIESPLQILPRKIEITSISISKVHDNEPLYGYGNDDEMDQYAWISLGSLVSGHTIQIVVSGVLLPDQVGSVENTIEKVIIYDGMGNDVTFNYDIDYKLGILKWI